MKKFKLPHGTLTTLAKEFNLSPSTIKNMLEGRYIHERQKEIFSRAKEIKKDFENKKDEVKKLQSELL